MGEGVDVFNSRKVLEEFMKEQGIQGTLLFSSIASDTEYNLALDSDQREYYGVFVAPTERIMGLIPPADTCIDKIASGMSVRLDEIKKWCKLVTHGSPKAIETLYSLPEFCYMSESWKQFVPEKRRSLLARSGVIHFVGFAKAHVFRHPKKKIRTGDTLLLVYQILRLLFVAKAMVEGEEPTVYLDQSSLDRQYLLDLKIEQQKSAVQDSPALQAALKRAGELIAEIDGSLETSPLQERVPVDELDNWFYSLRMNHMTT